MAFWRPGEQFPSASGGAGQDGSSERAAGVGQADVPAVLYNPNYRLPLDVQRQRLPVFAHRREILFAVETHATTILVGATGSGKTTQVPQYLMEAGWAQPRRSGGSSTVGRMIVCTQPRRLAATTIAARVAQEVGSPLGRDVGYAVRFDEQWDPQHTKIKFCTDGMLLRETMLDPLLSRYSVIMLDEAHERNLETDVLLGLIKKIQRKRPELRVIIASATLQVDTFTKFFRNKKRKPHDTSGATSEKSLGDVVAVSVEGRQYPVDIEYLKEPCGDYLAKTVETVLAIDKHEGPGDVLVFLPGQDEIDFVVRSLHERAPQHVVALPLYATLPAQMQQNVFLPAPRHVSRKVIVATTIAETSVTIEGVVFVVDSCFVKLAFYNPFTGIESLITTQVSKASAKQRAGRAGRVRAGKCFRLSTQDHFDSQLLSDTVPQMQRTNLASVALHLLSMGIQDIAHFEFVSPPSPEALIRALELLYSLGAIDESCHLVEPLGTQMAEFPVEPMLAKVLLSSFEYRCTEEILSIASMLSVGDVFVGARGSKDRRAKISEAMEQFAEPEGDHLMLLKVFDEFLDNGKRRSWCEDNMLNHQALTRATEIRKHLKRYVNRFCDLAKQPEVDEYGEDDIKTAVLKCFVSGYFANAAKLHYDGTYRTVRDGRVVQIHPTSVFYYMGRSPDWILFHQSILTTDEYIRDISQIDLRWLVSIAPDFYRTRDVSAVVSGNSGELGLPKPAPRQQKKPSTKGSSSSNSTGGATDAVPTSSDGRILFRKPTKAKDAKSKPSLPVHIGKSKGGLRSQF